MLEYLRHASPATLADAVDALARRSGAAPDRCARALLSPGQYEGWRRWRAGVCLPDARRPERRGVDGGPGEG
jgi:hypothetical protein